MVKDDPGSRRLALRLTAWMLLGAILPVAATSYLLARWLSPLDGDGPMGPAVQAVPAAGTGQRLFHEWPAAIPDVVLVLSGQMHGYNEPCGCSSPQLGGLERRYNFIKGLRERGWPVIAVDLGDIIDPPSKRGPQALLKYRWSMEALRLMDYSAVAVGQYEMNMPLLTTIAHYPLNYPKPKLLAANLLNRNNNAAGCVFSWEIVPGKGTQPTVGVVATVGPSVADDVKDPAVRFAPNGAALGTALKEMQGQENKPQVLVLLYQGTMDEAKEAAKHFPQFNVVLALESGSEPSDKAEKVGSTLVVGVGHKGRYLGVVGLFANAKKSFDLRYQMVPLSEDLKTPDDKMADHPIVKVMEAYARETHAGNYLAKYPQGKHPIQLQFPKAEYVGEAACMGCHRQSFQVWSNSKHAHAYQTLVDVKHPPLRQFDGECIACHVVGFGYETGFKSFKDTPDLINVSCESCHGPGSPHVDRPKDTTLHDLMNPWRESANETPEQKKKRELAIDLSCQKCHDIDNDVTWNFQKKWPFVVHREPKKNKPAAPGNKPGE